MTARNHPTDIFREPDGYQPIHQARTDHVRCVVLLSRPHSGALDIKAPVVGKRVIRAVGAAGGRITIEDDRIVLRWKGDFPGWLIDEIRWTRTGVVAALKMGRRN